MPRIPDPPHIAGFEYQYAPTSICLVTPTDVPKHHITSQNPIGRHKLVNGGYRCSTSKDCAMIYCYDCATSHFGNNGRESLAEYHSKFHTKERVRTCDPASKRLMRKALAKTRQTVQQEREGMKALSSGNSEPPHPTFGPKQRMVAAASKDAKRMEFAVIHEKCSKANLEEQTDRPAEPDSSAATSPVHTGAKTDIEHRPSAAVARIGVRDRRVRRDDSESWLIHDGRGV